MYSSSSSDEPTTVDPQYPSAFYSLELNLLRQFINPFRVSWALIRLGHEPIPPSQFLSPLPLIGWTTPIYIYPNLFRYSFHTIRTYGLWTVISTGVFASACVDFISELFRLALQSRMSIWKSWKRSFQDPSSYGDDLLTLDEDRSKSAFSTEILMEEAELNDFIGMLFESVSLKVSEIIISQPFLVIMVRQIAALIGKETQYNWFPKAVRAVLRETGLKGFFQGLVPRLLAEVVIIVIYYAACRVIRRGCMGMEPRNSVPLRLLQMFVYFGLRSYVYPLQLAGCIMTVRGARLLGASEANKFSDRYSLERYLTDTGQSNRGWLPFLRSHIQSKHLP